MLSITSATNKLRPLSLAMMLAISLPMNVSHAQGTVDAFGSVAADFNVPEGPLEDVLLAIARQTGRVVSFDPRLTKGLMVSAIEGRFTLGEALDRALRNTGLTRSITELGAIKITAQKVGLNVQEREPGAASVKANAASAEDVQQLETVVVGTFRSGVTTLTSAAPVDVISGDRLTGSGFTNLSQALQALAPSVNFPQNRASTGATSAKQASLRGLSPGEALVLINGKRWHTSGIVNTGDSFGRGDQAVDLASIPLVAIDRVEVLRDGASAQYGSDAIAGVVNIVLKARAAGARADAQIGQQTKGDGLTRIISGWKGYELGEGGFLTLSGSYETHDFTRLNEGTDTRKYYSATATYPVAHPELEGSAPRNWYTGLGDGENLSLVANGELPFNADTTLYGLANYSRRFTKQYSPWRLPNSNVNVATVTPDGYQVVGKGVPEDIAFLVGAKHGALPDGVWDLSLGYGRNETSLYANNSENPSYGIATPRNFFLGTLRNSQTNLTLDYKRELAPAFVRQPLVLSAGVARRWESYGQRAGDTASWAFGGVTGVPIGVTSGGYVVPDASAHDASRDVWAAYAGLEGEVVKDLSVGVTGRLEHYSDFGNASTGKLSARYVISPSVALRSTVNTAFKAPTIGQLSLYGDTAVQVAPTLANPSGRVDVLLAPVSSEIARLAGAQDLKPEKSHNISFGVVLTPSDSTTLTVDAYRIRIDDRIALSSVIQGNTVNGILANAGYPTIYGIQYFLNMGTTTTNGVDAVGTWKTRLAAGDLALSASWSYSKTTVDSVSVGSFAGKPLVDYFSVTSLIENAVPRQRGILSQDWKSGPWRWVASQTYYGPYGGANNQAPGTEFWFTPKWTVDVAGTYKFPAFDLTFGAQNLFGAKPEMVPNSSNGGRLSNSSLAAFNPGGTFLYLRLGKSF
ncbi:TonB-dependent receptor [Zoogloea sp. LCSB751]|uniref:TonB-dependent receptor n=1 Tax=Zoogloea sp. LCSB751 TaxID=1965277 RepID=UPI0009A52A54|nr:TonB-dependent receptor [Zoogloea sp. LCSB751]